VDPASESIRPILNAVGLGGVGLNNKRVEGYMELDSGDRLSISTFAYYDDTLVSGN
jgi:hypothetical protein